MRRGDPLALLTNPELWAAVGQARALVDKAKSDRDRVYAGVRQEEVNALQREILKAQAAHDPGRAGTRPQVGPGRQIRCLHRTTG